MKLKRLAIILCACSFFVGGGANGDIYTRTDENGIIYFTNRQPRGEERQQYKIYLRTPPQRRPRPGVIPVPPSDLDPTRYSKYAASIEQASRSFSVPEAFIQAIIRVESDFDPRVVSVAGAEGLMQLMPATAQRMSVKNSFDPHDNIMGGTRYLRYLANMFGGDMVLTIAGYHAGENAVIKYGGVPPYSTTHSYIKRVLAYYYRNKNRQ